MEIKQIYLILIVSIFSFSLFGQNNDTDSSKIKEKNRHSIYQYKKAWSISVFGGQSIVKGDVNINPKSFGYGLHVQKNLGHSLALRLVYAQGTSKGADRKYATKNVVSHNPALNGTNDSLINYVNNGKHTYMNFKMNYKFGTLDLVYKFDFQDFRTTQYPKTSLYLFLGAGALLFDTWTDQLDASGNLHDFDTIYNDYYNNRKTQLESKEAVIETLDGNYETALDGNPQGNAKIYDTEFLNRTAIPVFNGGIGIRYKLNKRFDISLESRVTYTACDILDGQRYSRSGSGGLSEYNDIFLFTTLGLNIRLGRTESIYWFDNPFALHYKVTLENKRKVSLLTNDSDNDGVSDYFDKDLDTPEGVKVDVNGVAMDSDNDGIEDYKDLEPFSDREAEVDSNGVSIDTDGDGVPNHKDLDNNTPEGQLVNIQGVTIDFQDRAYSPTGSELRFLPAIFFKFDNSNLSVESLKVLVGIAVAMKYYPDTKLKVIGYTDRKGSLEYNIILSKQRAENVVNFIVMQGVSKDRFILEAKGEVEPFIGINSTEDDRLNRRVQLKIIENTSQQPANEKSNPVEEKVEEWDFEGLEK